MPPGQPNGGGGADALAFGLMNHLRTGNPLLDMTLCSLVTPALSSVAVIVDAARPAARRVADFARRRGRAEYRRQIRYERRLTNWGSERAQGDDLAELGAELINGSPPPIDYATCTGW